MIEYKVKVNVNGDKFWSLNDKLHREDGPAIEYSAGNQEWFINGKRHREDGPACEYGNGTEEWYLNGSLHREDGPAVDRADGTKKWFINGRLHREDGPALEHANGTKQWWLNGRRVNKEMAKENIMCNPVKNTSVDIMEKACGSMRRNPSLRVGQALMGALYTINITVYNTIINTTADPFYANDNIGRFFAEVESSNTGE